MNILTIYNNGLRAARHKAHPLGGGPHALCLLACPFQN